MLAESLGKILGTREPAFMRDPCNALLFVRKKTMGSRLEPKPPGKSCDGLADNGLENPVEMK